jgi:hypothetical protein
MPAMFFFSKDYPFIRIPFIVCLRVKLISGLPILQGSLFFSLWQHTIHRRLLWKLLTWAGFLFDSRSLHVLCTLYQHCHVPHVTLDLTCRVQWTKSSVMDRPRDRQTVGVTVLIHCCWRFVLVGVNGNFSRDHDCTVWRQSRCHPVHRLRTVKCVTVSATHRFSVFRSNIPHLISQFTASVRVFVKNE